MGGKIVASLCCPIVHVPGPSAAAPRGGRLRQRDDAAGPVPVAERVVRSIMAAPMASPAPVMIGSRCQNPAQPCEQDDSLTQIFKLVSFHVQLTKSCN